MRSIRGDQKYSYPIPILVHDPSKYIFLVPSSMSKISSSGKSSLPSFPSMGFSAQISYVTLTLIVFLATYFNQTSLIGSTISIIFHSNWVSQIGTSMGPFQLLSISKNGRMMCLNFYTSHISAKHEFSMGVYLVS